MNFATMRRIALVLLFVAAVAAKEIKESEVVGSLKLYNSNSSRLVGAMNLLQTGINPESFIVLGHLWDVEPGKYIGIVYEDAPSQTWNFCSSKGPALSLHDDHIQAGRPTVLFLKQLSDQTDYRFISINKEASLTKGAKNSIMNRSVVIYRVSSADFGLCFVTREKIAEPIACGVVVPGPVQPGEPKIPDIMKDEALSKIYEAIEDFIVEK